MKYLKIILVAAVFLGGLALRGQHLYELGNDQATYVRAVDELLFGINPYEFTVKSFSQPNYVGDSGFSYLPGFLYLYSPIHMVKNATMWDKAPLWRAPVILADLAIAAFLFMKLKKVGFIPAILGSAIWLFNPYLIESGSYTYFDPFAILLMLIALHYLEKDDVLAGAFFALAVGFKTFPILLLPIFIFHSKHKLKFLAAGGLVALALFAPFMKSVHDLTTMLQGSLLVHGARRLQGRPFLFYISYMYRLEIFQIIPLWVYTPLASFSGWLVTLFLMLKKKLTDKYVLATIAFVCFYLFTPVLNRTYLLWGLPIFLLAMGNLFNKSWKYYASVLGLYAFYYWYLVQWVEGFHVKIPMP